MKLLTRMPALGAIGLAFLWCGAAEARNPHCAGGIQYVVQGMRDKDKGNLEDYSREMNKAVQQLTQCAAEDTVDFEALGYLGWAYAELDSACLAGEAFTKSMRGLQAKGDKKKVDWVQNNLNSYWARTFNDGIAKTQSAQSAYADFCKEPADEADRTLKGEAEKNYRAALLSLTHAGCLKPNDPQTIRNLGTVHLLMCDYQGAEAVLREGLKAAPGDTTLQRSLRTARVNYANLLVEQKKYDEALSFYMDLAKTEPNDPDYQLAIGDALFRRAQSLEAEARKTEFRAAGDAYMRAFELKPHDADLAFNAGLSYQNAGAFDRSEAGWRAALKIRPEDPDALSALASVLVELKKCDEAVQAAHHAVSVKSDSKILHRQFGAIYTRCGNNAKATEELMVYLALEKGETVSNPEAHAKEAKPGSPPAKAVASDGPPEQVNRWEAEGQKYETWFYWAKKRAYTFGSTGVLVTRSDWSVAALKSGK